MVYVYQMIIRNRVQTIALARATILENNGARLVSFIRNAISLHRNTQGYTWVKTRKPDKRIIDLFLVLF